jgi:hypothetical protein
MTAISKALETSPGIVIRQLGWKYGRTEIEGAGSGTRTAAGAALSGGSTASSRRQSGLIEGEVKPFRGDYRAAIESIHAFADRLAKDPAVAEARIVKLPLNIDPKLPLSGNTLDSGEYGGAADFKLVVILKAES